MHKFNFLIIFLSLFSISTAQTFEQTIEFADSAFSQNETQTALKAYKRAFFFSQGQQNHYLYLKIAECYSNNKEFTGSNKYLDYALSLSENVSVKHELTSK